MPNDEGNPNAQMTKAAMTKHSSFMVPADQFATIRPPVAHNKSDRAADSGVPAKIPSCLVSTGNRPSARATESVCYESARSFLPCVRRVRGVRRQFRFGVKPRRPTGFPQGASENKLATLHA